MLKPLQEWICDSCGEIIESPDAGYVEWKLTKDYKKYGFRVVHHRLHSPHSSSGGSCYYSNAERGGDFSLRDFVGAHGLLLLTSFIDVGKWHDRDYSGPGVRDLREWTTLFRRLHVPYFEQARLCNEATREVLEGGANELYLYSPDMLKHIIGEREQATD
jgi:hypothetical protein